MDQFDMQKEWITTWDLLNAREVVMLATPYLVFRPKKRVTPALHRVVSGAFEQRFQTENAKTLNASCLCCAGGGLQATVEPEQSAAAQSVHTLKPRNEEQAD